MEAGRAKLAQFRQKKALRDGQSIKHKKKKSSCKQDLDNPNVKYQGDGTSMTSSSCRDSAGNTRALATGELVQHGQDLSAEAESELSTTDESSSEVRVTYYNFRCCK